MAGRPTWKANCPLLLYMPQLYIRLRMFFTAGRSNTCRYTISSQHNSAHVRNLELQTINRFFIEFLSTMLTLSPVVGQMPPLARVAAMMAMLSHVISMEQHCR